MIVVKADPMSGYEIEPPHVAIFLPSFGNGGVERMMVNLATGIAARGARVDFVLRNSDVPYIGSLSSSVRLVELDRLDRNTLNAASRYLSENKPAALLSSKDENDEIAVHAREKAGVDTRVIVRVPVNVSSRLEHKRSSIFKKWATYRKTRIIYNQADSLVAVSNGVASDIFRITGKPMSSIHVIRNPVITPALEELSSVPLDHHWYNRKKYPIVLGIGRLGRQKNFELLIKAFGKARNKMDCRLLILGEGRRRTRLERLVRKLGLSESVQLPGFVANPYAYLKGADLFVLSSLWEGSPNALIEALALGVPVVSTDCESGPREILKNGKFGHLVPVDDMEGLTSAIIRTLREPLPGEYLKSAVYNYSLEAASRSYLEVLIGEKTNPDPSRQGSDPTVLR